MLTKTDFKEIRKIIREEVEMKMNLVRTLTEVREIKDRLKNVEIKILKIQKDLKYAVNFLDKEGLRISKKVERIEKHLSLEPISS